MCVKEYGYGVCEINSSFSQVLETLLGGQSLHGGQMCLVNLISGASNYIKALFVTM